jgi:threonine/homoserine/homoserine lactone efflux protein
MEIPSILKYTFLLHMIVAIVLGIWYFIAPNTWVDLVSWPYFDPSVDRVMAAMMIGLGVTSLLGYRADSYEKVEIIVMGEIISCLLSTIGMIWFMLGEVVPPLIGWVLTGIMALLFVLFTYAYYIVKK